MTSPKRPRAKPIRASSRDAIQVLRARLSEAELRALFEDIRANRDRELLGPRAKAPSEDALVEAVKALLAPSPASSARKGAMLVAELERLTGRSFGVAARGLADAVRRLRAHLSDDDIRDGAFSLRVTLSQEHASAAQQKKGPR